MRNLDHLFKSHLQISNREKHRPSNFHSIASTKLTITLSQRVIQAGQGQQTLEIRAETRDLLEVRAYKRIVFFPVWDSYNHVKMPKLALQLMNSANYDAVKQIFFSKSINPVSQILYSSSNV